MALCRGPKYQPAIVSQAFKNMASETHKKSPVTAPQTEIERRSTVATLVAEWYACREEIAKIEARQDELFFSEQANTQLFFKLDAQRDELRNKSDRLMSEIRDTESDSCNEVRAKLQLWRDVRFPDGSRLKQKDTVDQITVSALEDLDRMVG